MACKLKKLHGFLADESGATAIEYGLIAAIVCLGIIVSLTQMSGELKTLFSKVATGMTTS
jgi:pilus assembly protein Flp/PilA